jgi:methionine-rich copper-binding protein CopC
MSVSRTLAFALAVILGFILPTHQAAAHSALERSSPPANAVLSRAPGEVRLSFSQRIEPRFSQARLTDVAGAIVAGGSSASGKQIVLRLPRLQPGVYRVNWSVVSVDTHKSEGSFSFEIRP